MTEREDLYESPLNSRYCRGSPITEIFSERSKTEAWRQLWIWLAEAEFELGLKQICPEAIQEMRDNIKEINWPLVKSSERRLKHDVMAHNYCFGEICPKAKGIIHLGATSCYVQDNGDLINQRAALDHILVKMAVVLQRVAVFAEKNKEVITVGRTHYQTASLVTVGKRAAIWGQELLMAFEEIERFREEIRFRGIKGATGTQDSFMTLFNGDEDKVEQLDEIVTKKAGFKHKFFIAGQTYSRQQDLRLINCLATVGAVIKKISLDIRVLQALNELLEPFEENQIGSSAMPYKRNPMKNERCCSLARKLLSAPQEALGILADQGLERTLDDSANRRMLIPESFLLVEALLTTMQNIFEGLTVQKENVDKIVKDELPFLALERAMMMLTDHGGDRQVAHHVIREASLAAKEMQKTKIVSLKDIISDPFFDSIRDELLKMELEPIVFTGRCVSQVTRFLSTELYPKIQKYLTEKDIQGSVSLDV
uniref:Adenylosuccinate lyase n=1 Tax=Rhabditophanes sp. KR3021 TaxID=114890 RepID=A0AC35U934_9BILA